MFSISQYHAIYLISVTDKNQDYLSLINIPTLVREDEKKKHTNDVLEGSFLASLQCWVMLLHQVLNYSLV